MSILISIFSKYAGLAIIFALGIGCWVGRSKFRGFNPGGGTGSLMTGTLGRSALVILAFAAAACKPPEPPRSLTSVAGEWREFEGSWNAAGSRRTISLGADRRGSIIDLRGEMMLAGSGRPSLGFHSEVIALVDSETGLTGRSVWTDERGEQVFSELKGEGTAAKNHMTGTIMGGTGRYAGATGSYEFSWRFVIEAEDGSIQGSTVGLKGRVRSGQPAEGGSKP